jgi:hypothetical protein
MKFNELANKLQQLKKQLESINVEDPDSLDLYILANRLKSAMIVSSFDSMQDLSALKVPEVTKLDELINAVTLEIQNEQKRVKLVRQVLAISKKVISTVALPV